jgi:hypothetical protein
VLCSDKTGTLTLNELTVGAIRPVRPGYAEADVLGFAALASSADGQDLIDFAIRRMWANDKRARCAPSAATNFKPFDPADKMAEATAVDDQGREIRWISNARGGCRSRRFARTDRLYRLQRSAAARLSRIAGGVALARRACRHGDRRRRRNRHYSRSRDWA